ncbi:AP2-like ethylene-responsive transcription factor AIL7 [Picochlorum sp. SENEW3]|nr:AP2-like ethylene-responsive transcription factor AIL7 [Picochlorum sp. SENEW3]
MPPETEGQGAAEVGGQHQHERNNSLPQHAFDDIHGLHNLTPEDFGKLLDSDDAYLDLDIPDNLFGPDGHILLESDFVTGLTKQQEMHQEHHHVQQQPQTHHHHQQQSLPQQHQQQNASVADAARSVLASLDSTMQQEQSAMSIQHAHSAPQIGHVQNGACFSTHTNHSGGMPLQGHFIGSGNMQQPMFIQDAQGNFIQVSGGGHMQSMYLPGVPYQPGQVHYVVHQQQVPSVSFGQVPVYETGSVQNSPRKSPGKRRRQRQSTETVQQRSARAESGFTRDPSTGEVLRHGPALMATARDNKEVPIIKAVFQNFDKNSGFSQPPMSPFVGIQIPETNDGKFQKEINIEARAGGGPSDGRAGHEFQNTNRHESITSLVTKELRSSTPQKPTMPGEDGSSQPVNLRGVARDKWSLFWDAYIEKPMEKTEGSVVEGLKKEAIFLGKFPSRDQAGRAHDLAALKILGDDAPINFPKEIYKATLPVLNAHSEDELIRALMKDSELARQRTSKFKGVRRTGPGQYEAQIDAGVVAASAQDAAKKAQQDQIYAPHNTETFNA